MARPPRGVPAARGGDRDLQRLARRAVPGVGGDGGGRAREVAAGGRRVSGGDSEGGGRRLRPRVWCRRGGGARAPRRRAAIVHRRLPELHVGVRAALRRRELHQLHLHELHDGLRRRAPLRVRSVPAVELHRRRRLPLPLLRPPLVPDEPLLRRRLRGPGRLRCRLSVHRRGHRGPRRGRRRRCGWRASSRRMRGGCAAPEGQVLGARRLLVRVRRAVPALLGRRGVRRPPNRAPRAYLGSLLGAARTATEASPCGACSAMPAGLGPTAAEPPAVPPWRRRRRWRNAAGGAAAHRPAAGGAGDVSAVGAAIAPTPFGRRRPLFRRCRRGRRATSRRWRRRPAPRKLRKRDQRDRLRDAAVAPAEPKKCGPQVDGYPPCHGAIHGVQRGGWAVLLRALLRRARPRPTSAVYDKNGKLWHTSTEIGMVGVDNTTFCRQRQARIHVHESRLVRSRQHRHCVLRMRPLLRRDGL